MDVYMRDLDICNFLRLSMVFSVLRLPINVESQTPIELYHFDVKLSQNVKDFVIRNTKT